VVKDPPAGQLRLAEPQPAGVDRLDQQLLDLAYPAGDITHIRVIGQQLPVLVAQRQNARRLAPDDRRSGLRPLHQPTGQRP
jgi:hypothetical protein